MPTYPWNEITQAQTDADSPLDTTLMEGLRQNLVHLKEWLGGSFTPEADHDHDGVNSSNVALADSTVSVAKLRLGRGSFSASTGGDYYISISRYSHIPGLNKAGSGYTAKLLLETRAYSSTGGEIWEVLVQTPLGSGDTFSVYWDYHTN